MQGLPRCVAMVWVVLASVAATCGPVAGEVTRERAIAIAQPQAGFSVVSTEAERGTDEGRPVWRVTFRGPPASPQLPELRPFVMVVIDRRTGEVVSVAKS